MSQAPPSDSPWWVVQNNETNDNFTIETVSHHPIAIVGSKKDAEYICKLHNDKLRQEWYGIALNQHTRRPSNLRDGAFDPGKVEVYDGDVWWVFNLVRKDSKYYLRSAKKGIKSPRFTSHLIMRKIDNGDEVL